MNPPPRYWFPAKRIGWGWGPPVAWQGWAVLTVFAIALLACALVLLPKRQTGSFLTCSLILTLVMFAICWVKGEPPGKR